MAYKTLHRVRDSVAVTNTFGETSIATNLSLDRGYIWLIHKVLFCADSFLNQPGASSNEYFTWQLTRETNSAILTTLDANDLIAYRRIGVSRGAAVGTDAGPIVLSFNYPLETIFPEPIAFAGSYIYLGVHSSNSSEVVLSCELQFSLQKVSQRDYLSMAAALLDI